MTLKKRNLIAIGVAVFVVALIIMLPARVVTAFVDDSVLAVNGVSGTAWNGRAREASAGDIYLQDIEWRLQPLSLFTGKATYHINARPVSGFIQSDVSVGLNGRVLLSDMQGAIPLHLLDGALGVRGLEGNASLSFARLELVDGVAVAADGTLEIAGLIVPLLGRNSLGGYRAEFYTQNTGVTASIEDTDGVVDLAGSLELGTDRSFAFLALVSAKPETPQSLRQQLSYLPPANDRGQQEIRLEGVL